MPEHTFDRFRRLRGLPPQAPAPAPVVPAVVPSAEGVQGAAAPPPPEELPPPPNLALAQIEHMGMGIARAARHTVAQGKALAVSRRPPTKASPPAYAPCPTCGVLVLTGETTAGGLVALDPHAITYAPVWLPDTPRPVLHESRAYPVHPCAQGGA